MKQQCSDMSGPSIEEVCYLFEQWRTEREPRTPIPDDLWAKAVSLCAGHSVNQIAKSLRLSYSDLMKRVTKARKETSPEPVISHAFVELDMKASMPEAEYIMEMENRNGSKLKMHIKGNTGTDTVEIIRAFWDQWQ